MKNKKIFKYNTTIFISIFLIITILSLTVSIILYPKQIWLKLIPLIILNICYWYLFRTGFFTPIYYNSTGISYRNYKYKWQEIKITAYPALHKSYHYGYYLVFGNQYLYEDKLKKQINTGFYIYLSKRSICEIFKYYNKKIIILDVMGKKEAELKSTKKLKSIIDKHNNINDC